MDGSRAAFVLLAATLALALPVTAVARTDVPDVALALGGDPLFVDGDAADALSQVETGQLRVRLRTASTPVFLAVLAFPERGPAPGPAAPPDPANSASGLPAAIAAEADRPGTYAVVAGTDFQAISTVIGERAGELAAATLAAVSDGATTATALLEFVDAVEVAAGQVGPGALFDDHDDGGDGSGPLRMPDPWIVSFAAVGGLLVYGARRRRCG